VQIGIFDADVIGPATKSIKHELVNMGIDSFHISSHAKSKLADCIIVLGGDRGVRNYFHGSYDSDIPVLGINESESSGFLAQIDLKEFPSYINRLKNKKYKIEEIGRTDAEAETPILWPPDAKSWLI